MKGRFLLAAGLTCLICFCAGYAQSPAQNRTAQDYPALNINPFPEKLPLGYRSIVLGMDIETVKQALKKEGVFGYKGERDVSLLPGENRVLIETSSDGYFSRCWFQFYEDKLYTFILNFNPEKMDFYSVFTRLLGKYGNPERLTPEKIEWIDENVLLSLERPVSLKYIDRKVFEKLGEEKKVEQAASEIIRSRILEDL
ncbi:hypothetical protein H0R92_07995 [Treponema sp. OMZ 840]|uniref:hypothetical protein n=1 Tax=Treponema sp. OMZ 840 TaxID=244313 RepID=UPI003D8AF671